MKMPFVEIRGINLSPISLVIKYCFCKSAALRNLWLNMSCFSPNPHKNHAWPDRVVLASVPILLALSPDKRQPGSKSN